MLPHYEQHYLHYAKVVYVNTADKDVTDVMTPNRLVVSLVFVSGIAVAVIGTLLSQYIRGLSTDFIGERSSLHRFSAEILATTRASDQRVS